MNEKVTWKETVMPEEVKWKVIDHLLSSLNSKFTHPTILGSDSKVVIRALDNQWLHPSLDNIHQLAENLHKKQDGLINHVEREAEITDGEVGLRK